MDNITSTSTSLASQNVTSGPENENENETLEEIVGYVVTFFSCLLIGSFLVPARKFFTGDGVFYQLMMNNVIMVTALVVNIILGMPRFEPFVMISGAMWCTSNLGTILTIRCIGLGIGMNMWSLVNLIVGWAAGRFGFFGPPQVPSIDWLQYLGIAVAILRGVIAGFITPAQRKASSEAAQSTEAAPISDKTFSDITLTAVRKLSRALSTTSSHAHPTEFHNVLAYVDSVPESSVTSSTRYSELAPAQSSDVHVNQTAAPQKKDDFIDKLSVTNKRIIGFCLAVFCGLGFGLQFEPINIMKQNGGSVSDRDYTLSYFAGSFVCSMFYSSIYLIMKRNRPFADGRLMLPAFAGGLMWSVGMTGRLISQETLSQSISFPIYTAVPSLVSLFWGFFYFKEIKGRRNVILFVIVAVLTVVSVLMVSYSK